MEIRKIGKLTEEERKLLSDAGSLLGSLVKAFASGDLDSLVNEDSELIEAILDVANRAANKQE